MKLPRSLYNIFQYFSTIDDAFAYIGNGYLIQKNKIGSGFVEVKAPDYFFKEQLIIRSLSKFLRLFTYDKKDKEADPLSVQDWTLGQIMNPITKAIKPMMYLKSPGRNISLVQGRQNFADVRRNDLVSKFDTIELEDSIKFQITSAQYKQIIGDCSLLNLDTILISSENDNLIRIYLMKKDKKLEDDNVVFDIECQHQHKPTRIKIDLSVFSLIEATDHQIEFGKFQNKYGTRSNVVKIRSFCDNNFVVNKVMIGSNGD